MERGVRALDRDHEFVWGRLILRRGCAQDPAVGDADVLLPAHEAKRSFIEDLQARRARAPRPAVNDGRAQGRTRGRPEPHPPRCDIDNLDRDRFRPPAQVNVDRQLQAKPTVSTAFAVISPLTVALAPPLLPRTLITRNHWSRLYV